MFKNLFVSALILAFTTATFAEQRDPQPRATEFSAYSGGAGTNGALGELSTGFETFTLGDINTQQGWTGQFGNWVIDNTRPNTGAQHVESVSDGLGQTLLFSPDVGIGVNPVNSAGFSVQISGTGASWQLAIQSPSAGFVNTQIQIAADGSVNALVSDGMGGGGFVPIGFSMPLGEYVSFIIEVDRTTFDFEVFVNGISTFTGVGFSGDIEQFVGIGLMEAGTDGDTLDIDDVFIIDGPAPILPPGPALPVSVNSPWALAFLLAMLMGLGLITIRRSL